MGSGDVSSNDAIQSTGHVEPTGRTQPIGAPGANTGTAADDQMAQATTKLEALSVDEAKKLVSKKSVERSSSKGVMPKRSKRMAAVARQLNSEKVIASRVWWLW